MRCAVLVLLPFVLPACVLSVGAADLRPQPVPAEEAALWSRWAIPLPKQMTFSGKLVLGPADVGVRVRRDGTDLERSAAEQLNALFAQRTGSPAGGHAFRIVLGVCDGAGEVNGVHVIHPAALRALPNSEQAYAIKPVGDNALYLTALDARGVFYAARTLCQLLERNLSAEQVTVPLVEVLDWPDLEERGEWGGSCMRDIEWLASYKMNLIEPDAQLRVNADGTGVATTATDRLHAARLHALNYVPHITHMEHLTGVGLYAAYPELRGIGEKANYQTLYAPCASKPQFAKVLADFMDDLASIEGITDICAWLSETHVQCGCDDCLAAGQYALEARSLVNAWRMAREKHPDIRLRILLTQGSYETNDKVLAEIPPEVGVTYYDGGRTYDSSKEPMIFPLLEQFAGKGGWLGCYPQLTASWRIVCPWTGPQFIHARMNEFVDKKLSCLCGYATPDNRPYAFNIIAAAEWSWNAKGRSPREFAAAWATREGFADPDAVAEWAMRMGDVGWNLYGSRVPYSAFFGSAAASVKQRRVPTLGSGMYRYYTSLEQLDADLSTCRWAEAQAEALGSPLLKSEARAVGGMLGMLRAIHDLGATLQTIEGPDEAARQELHQGMHTLALAAQKAVTGHLEWKDAVEGWDGAARFIDTIDCIDKTASDIGEYMATFGIPDPGKPYRGRSISKWAAEDFDKERTITREVDVTDAIFGPGTYVVGFKYTSGWHGLNISRVALTAAPKANPEQRTEIAVDEHNGVTGARPVDNEYALELTDVPEDSVFTIVARISGVSNIDKPENRRDCNGEVWMRRAGSLPEDMPLPPLPPMTPEQAAAFGPPQFKAEGLHVGILGGGYGALGIKQWLQQQEGIEVREIGRPSVAMIKPCAVVIIPQPFSPDTVKPEDVQALRAAVQGGMGLVVTHDAAGFRDHPVIIPEVCAGGKDKSRQTKWTVAAEHPVTAGIATGVAHPQSYYDQIMLLPGKSGIVLATQEVDGEPVAIVGEFGKGRYVAIGLAVGLSADTADTAPQGAEAQLMLNAVRWAGQRM
jgi:hypothetical protein